MLTNFYASVFVGQNNINMFRFIYFLFLSDKMVVVSEREHFYTGIFQRYPTVLARSDISI